MVRVWTPTLISVLDDNRLPAQHAEVHYMLNALCRGASTWWLHPETQRWWGREAQLRAYHDMVVVEMTVRGFRHDSPAPGPRDLKGLLSTELHDLDQIRRDYRDLHHKWTTEGRITPQGYVYLGSAVTKEPMPHEIVDHLNGHRIHEVLDTNGLGELKSGRIVYGFRTPRNPVNADQAAELTDTLERWAHLPAREWKRADTERLREACRDRGPTSDLTETEWASYVDPARYPWRPSSLPVSSL